MCCMEMRLSDVALYAGTMVVVVMVGVAFWHIGIWWPQPARLLKESNER